MSARDPAPRHASEGPGYLNPASEKKLAARPQREVGAAGAIKQTEAQMLAAKERDVSRTRDATHEENPRTSERAGASDARAPRASGSLAPT